METDEDLQREIYASVEVIKSQQSEIYRRLGRLEKKLEEAPVLVSTVGDLETRVKEIEGRRYATIKHIWIAFLGALGALAAALFSDTVGLHHIIGQADHLHTE